MTVGIDSLYGWYVQSISAHFRILRCKLKRAALKLQNHSCVDFSKDIGSIVYYHNRTLKFVQDLNAIFGEILWAEVMLSCLQMCFVIYTLNNDADVSNMPFNFLAFVVVTIQLMIYCFGGEKIKNEVNRFKLKFLKLNWFLITLSEFNVEFGFLFGLYLALNDTKGEKINAVAFSALAKVVRFERTLF